MSTIVGHSGRREAPQKFSGGEACINEITFGGFHMWTITGNNNLDQQRRATGNLPKRLLPSLRIKAGIPSFSKEG